MQQALQQNGMELISIQFKPYLHSNWRRPQVRIVTFAIAQSPSGEHLLCVHDSAICDDSTKPQFYDTEGNLDSRVIEFLNFLKEFESSKIVTQNATNLLSELNLVTSWNIELNTKSKDENVKVEGLYRIDEEKLNSLDAGDLKRLRDAGALSLAYGQIFSINQLELFANLSAYHEQSASFAAKGNYAVTPDSGSLNFENF